MPAATAQGIFNTDELFRIFAQARTRDGLAATRTAVEQRLQARRGGTPDFTVVAQDSLLGTLDRIFVSDHFKVEESGVHSSQTAKRASDHLPVWATVKRTDFGLGLYAPNVSDQVKLSITTEAIVPKAAE